jgi:hypothetical protein
MLDTLLGIMEFDDLSKKIVPTANNKGSWQKFQNKRAANARLKYVTRFRV